MRKRTVLVATLALSALAGCTNQQLQTACVIDGVAQPIAVTIGTTVASAAGAAPVATATAAADGQIHAAVQGACRALNGTAVVNNTTETTVAVTTNGATAAAVAASK